jgi:hypothetical protein
MVKKSNRLDDLKHIDKQVYDNLMYLKSYDGDVEDLCLTMCYTDNNFGQQRTVNFIPGGQDVAVTNENKM